MAILMGLENYLNKDSLILLMNDKNIKSIHCGIYHTMIYKNNGDVLVFGINKKNQLGLGDYEDRLVPTLLINDINVKSITCGCFHNIIYKNNGDIFVFCFNNE